LWRGDFAPRGLIVIADIGKPGSLYQGRAIEGRFSAAPRLSGALLLFPGYE